MSLWKTRHDENWQERATFTPLQDTVYGSVVCAQAPWKAAETPPRTTWVSRPVGDDNGFVYLNYLGYPPVKLKELEEKEII